MPQLVPIQTVPNQSFSITLSGNLFQMVLRVTEGVMSASVGINGEAVIDNMRVVAGSAIIPSEYEEAGNFMFVTQNQELPDYTQFNTTQVLLYYTAAELEAFRTAPTPPVTADFFNPLGALPLRFAPQNYTLVI